MKLVRPPEIGCVGILPLVDNPAPDGAGTGEQCLQRRAVAPTDSALQGDKVFGEAAQRLQYRVLVVEEYGRATKYVAPDTQAAADEARRVIDLYRDRMKFQLINLPFCFMPGYEEFLTGDLLKLSRHMIFVNNEEVNLGEYLAERRTKKPVCDTCAHASFCGGFYELDKVPEPPWLIAPEDLLRPVRRESP